MKTKRAYSYARFSAAHQSEGASLQRQLQQAAAYCDRNGLTLDERTFSDLGVSGFTGSNLAGGLGEFLDLVKAGRIPKGSVLIVENVDRLSRLPARVANDIISSLVEAGIDVVTTSPEAVYTAANIDKLATWLPLQIAQTLAHEESVKKGDRVRDAWNRKRARLVAGEKIVNQKCPFWLRPSEDRTHWVVREEEADLMRQVFAWAIEGLGAASICGKLAEIRPGGITGKGWQPNNLRKIMRSTQLIGELEIRTGRTARKGAKSTLKATGQKVAGYYPAIISETDFYRVQTLMGQRTHGGGRTVGVPNLFAGLMVNVNDGQPMAVTMGRNRKRMLVTRAALRKVPGVAFCAVPYDLFEGAVLDHLEELTPDMLGAAPAANEVEEWSGKLTAVNHKLAKANERAARSEDPDAFNDQIEILAKDRKAIIAGLEAAKQKHACPAADALGECVSLVSLLQAAPSEERDDLRRRVQAALRRLVKRIYVDVAFDPKDRESERHAFVRLQFFNGLHRDYCFSWRRGGLTMHLSEAHKDGTPAHAIKGRAGDVSGRLNDLIRQMADITPAKRLRTKRNKA